MLKKCTSDADCTEGENGRCTGNAHDGWQCTYDECFADSDCASAADGAPQVCGCAAGPSSNNNVCLPGNCRLDTDCGAGGYCSPSLDQCGDYTLGYFCHVPKDECVDDADCVASIGKADAYCAFNSDAGHWKCAAAHCVE
jgi:hypothetical protein